MSSPTCGVTGTLVDFAESGVPEGARHAYSPALAISSALPLVVLSISFDTDLVVLVVRQGRITAIESGHCIITGALAIAGSEVAKRQGRFDLCGEIPLGHGLVPGGPTATAASTKRAVVTNAQSPAANWYRDPVHR